MRVEADPKQGDVADGADQLLIFGVLLTVTEVFCPPALAHDEAEVTTQLNDKDEPVPAVYVIELDVSPSVIVPPLMFHE